MENLGYSLETVAATAKLMAAWLEGNDEFHRVWPPDGRFRLVMYLSGPTNISAMIAAFM